MKVKICPHCKSTKIGLNLGGKTGKYECKDCNYIGDFVIEEDR